MALSECYLKRIRQLSSAHFAASVAPGSGLHNKSAGRKKAFWSDQRFSPGLVGTTRSTIVWHLSNGSEKAKSISLRRPCIVIRIRLPVAGSQERFMEQALSRGGRERKDWEEREGAGSAYLICSRKWLHLPLPNIPPALPASLHVGCWMTVTHLSRAFLPSCFYSSPSETIKAFKRKHFTLYSNLFKLQSEFHCTATSRVVASVFCSVEYIRLMVRRDAYVSLI